MAPCVPPVARSVLMSNLLGSSQMPACLDVGHHTKALSEACLFTFLRSSLSTLLDGIAPCVPLVARSGPL